MTAPNVRFSGELGPNPATIEVPGFGRIQVSGDFNRLSAADQQAAIDEIAAEYTSHQPQEATVQQPPAQDNSQGALPLVGEDTQIPDWLYQNAPGAAVPLEMARDFTVGAAQGAGEVLDAAAGVAQGIYNQTAGRIFGTSDSATVANEGDAGFEGAANRLGPDGSPVGREVGRIGTAAYLTRNLPGPVTQGGGAGALLSDADTPGATARDAVIGGVGGKLGERVITGLGRVIEPQIERGVRALRDSGVSSLTPGQIFPALRPVEDRMMNWPFIGPGLQRQRREGFEEFSRVIPRQAHDVIRERIPGRGIAPMADGLTGQEAVRQAGDTISGVYNEVIPQLTLRADDELVAGIRAVGQRLEQEALTPEGRRTFERLVRNGVMGRMSGAEATGAQYQAADTYLENQIARFGRSTDPDHQLIAEGLRDIRANLRNGVVRQNGELGQQLEAADEAWSMLAPAEQAASGAPRGYFSPAQYRAALKSGDNRVRRRGMARGEVRGQELAEAGQDVLPSQYPNYSGTGGQEAYNMADMRFYQGLGAKFLYGRPVRDTIVGGAYLMDQLPRAATHPLAKLINLLPAPQAGAAGAVAAYNGAAGR